MYVLDLYPQIPLVLPVLLGEFQSSLQKKTFKGEWIYPEHIELITYLIVPGLSADLDDNVDVILDSDVAAGLVVVGGVGVGPSELVQFLSVLQLCVAVDEQGRVVLVGQAARVKRL